MSLWTAKELFQFFRIGPAPESWEVSHVSIDSRTIEPGSLFIAIKGENQDGHRYAAQAYHQGAVAVLVDHAIDGIPRERQLIVPDTFEALTELGMAARSRSTATFIGITGSVGKTSTKDMLAAALSAAQGSTVYATKGNLNNHYGVPLTLANMPRDAKIAIIEMGMNHTGEIRALTQIARPHLAIITAIAEAHLEFFDSVESIARAKAEIFEGMRSDGVALLPADSLYFPILEQAARARDLRILRCGETEDADVKLVQFDTMKLEATAYPSSPITYSLPTPAKHLALNSLFAIATASELGLDVQQAAAALGQAELSGGRGQRYSINIGGKQVTLIDDSYNANPASMRAAFSLLANAPARKIAVLGDMLELGPRTEELHASLALPLQEQGIDAVLTVGQHMQILHDALPETLRLGHAATVEEAFAQLPNLLQENDTLLLKGSHGSGIYKLVEKLRTLSNP